MIVLSLLFCQCAFAQEGTVQTKTEGARKFCAWIEKEGKYAIMKVDDNGTVEGVHVLITDAEGNRPKEAIVIFQMGSDGVTLTMNVCPLPDTSEAYKIINDANVAAQFAVYRIAPGRLTAIYMPAIDAANVEDITHWSFNCFVEDVYRIMDTLDAA